MKYYFDKNGKRHWCFGWCAECKKPKKYNICAMCGN